MPPTHYSDRAAKELPAEAATTWKREAMQKAMGDLVCIDATYTLTTGTDEAADDVIRICKLPAGFRLIPHLCQIIRNDPGTAFNIAKIGDRAVDGTTADNDDDRYSTAIDLSAAGTSAFAFAAQAAGLAGYTTVREMWLEAVLGTITAPTAGQTIRFLIVGTVQS